MIIVCARAIVVNAFSGIALNVGVIVIAVYYTILYTEVCDYVA